MEGEFKKLSDFEKYIFMKNYVKLLKAKIKRLENNQEIKNLHTEIGTLTSERDEWKDLYEKMKKKKEKTVEYESLSPKQKKKARASMKDDIVNSLQAQLGIAQETIRKRNKQIEELEGEWTRDEFMKFFRDDDKLHTLSADDRVEIFMHVLPGSSDITADRLNELLDNYSVEYVRVVETNVKNKDRNLWLDALLKAGWTREEAEEIMNKESK